MSKRTLIDRSGRGGDGAPPWSVQRQREDPATACAPRHGAPRRRRDLKSSRKRFAFEPATIEVTEGERVRLVVRSADGVHGIGIKKFKVNKPVPRGGKPVTIEFVAVGGRHLPDPLLGSLRRRSRGHARARWSCSQAAAK